MYTEKGLIHRFLQIKSHQYFNDILPEPNKTYCFFYICKDHSFFMINLLEVIYWDIWINLLELKSSLA